MDGLREQKLPFTFDLDKATDGATYIGDFRDYFRACITSVDMGAFSWEGAEPYSLSGLFEMFSSLKEFEFPSKLDTSAVTNVSFMFYGCESLRNVDLTNMNMAAVGSMDYMFESCPRLEYVVFPSEAKWPKNITDVDHLFSGCKSLRSVDLSFINFFDRSRGGLRIDGMFNNCTALRSVYVRSKEDAKVLESCRKPTGMQGFTKILVQAEV